MKTTSNLMANRWVSLTLPGGARPLWTNGHVAVRRAQDDSTTIITVAGKDFSVAEDVEAVKALLFGR
jgi:hypothetical protein